jgi:integrase
LSEAEIARLAEAIDAEAAQKSNPFPSAAIKLLLLTGCRRGEIIGLRWEHIDFERQCIRLPDSKESQGSAKVVYLNPPALELLRGLPHLAGNPHVIAGERGIASARRPGSLTCGCTICGILLQALALLAG